jgi:hypothetical protein
MNTSRALITRGAAILVAASVAVVVPAGVAAAGGPAYGNPSPGDKCGWPGLTKCVPVAWTGFGEMHIVTDGLAAAEGQQGTGSVTFWCQSKIDFQYSVAVEGLSARTAYTVRYVTQAEEQDAPIDPDGPAGVLGTLRTDKNGSGKLQGVVPLPAGEYSFAVQVVDGADNVVLEPAMEQAWWLDPSVWMPDTNGFGVY